MLHEVSREFPGIAVDAYCEKSARWVEACVKRFEKAPKHHPLRAHLDQFNPLGLLPKALRLHARSVDHLEASKKNDLTALARSGTIGVALRGTGLHTDGRYAPVKFKIDQGGVIAPGMRAGLVILPHKDERALTYELGGNPVDTVICAGRRV